VTSSSKNCHSWIGPSPRYLTSGLGPRFLRFIGFCVVTGVSVSNNKAIEI